jgi:hypothetical protein
MYYSSRYSKYVDGLLINMSRFYIHCGLPCYAVLTNLSLQESHSSYYSHLHKGIYIQLQICRFQNSSDGTLAMIRSLIDLQQFNFEL